jgi:hypothetical protein
MTDKKIAQQTENNQQMTTVRLHFSIITLNVNGLNLPKKRHRVAECITQKVKPRFSVKLFTRNSIHI